jgi:hypothetical protein
VDVFIGSSYKDSYIDVFVDENPLVKKRSGVVKVQSKDATHLITVVQEPQSSMSISPKTFKISDEEKSISVKVKINNFYGIRTSEDWIVASNSEGEDGECRFIIKANEEYDDREGAIIFETSDMRDTVKVWQCKKDGLILGSNDVFINSAGEQLSFEVKSNVDYEYELEKDVDWVTELKTKGLFTNNHIFVIKANPNTKDRTAKIIFNSKSGKLQDVLKIHQEGRYAHMIITHSNDTWDIPEVYGEEVVCKVDWGDGGDIDDYSSFLSHVYKSSGIFDVKISAKNVDSVFLNSLKNVSTIDLSNF